MQLGFPLNSRARRVVHIHNDPYDVFVGRPSKWGNPFRAVREADRPGVIAAYRDYLTANRELMAALPELRGKVLGCYCAPRRCHADVLAELANGVCWEVDGIEHDRGGGCCGPLERCQTCGYHGVHWSSGYGWFASFCEVCQTHGP